MPKTITKKEEKAKSKAAARQPTKPTFKWCPETGDKIWITSVTVSEIKRAQKTGDVPNAKGKKQLVRISSKQIRENCYEEAARAIEARENQVLPTFGGRPWRVTCRVTEPTKNRQRPPLFRWFRGNLELAVLPHLLEKVPEMSIHQKGIAKVMEDTEEGFYNSSTDLCERTESQLSRMAWNDTEYSIPQISLKWLSPNYKIFNSRKSAEQHAKQLVDEQVFIDKVIFGHGARGQPLRPTKPTKADALKAGLSRFLRDGLWVVGQEESWQEQRTLELKKEAETRKVKEVSKNVKKPKPSTTSVIQRPIQLFLKTQRVEYRRVMLEKLREIMDEPQFTLSDADRELRLVWKDMIPEEKQLWKDLLEGKDVKYGEQNSLTVMTSCHVTDNRNEDHNICKKESITSQLDNEVSLDPVVVTPGDSDNEDQNSKQKVEKSTVHHQKENLVSINERCATKPVLGNIEEENKTNMDLSVRRSGRARKKRQYDLPDDPTPKKRKTRRPSMWAFPKHPILSQGPSEEHITNNVPRSATMVQEGEDNMKLSNPTKVLSHAQNHPDDNDRIERNKDNEQSDLSVSSREMTKREEESEDSVAEHPEDKAGDQKSSKRKRLIDCPPRQIAQSCHWRLSNSQVAKCHNAATEHFEKVMYTVQARSLIFELADGFDLLRERGRGRYDMELPAFDTPSFSFLTDLEKTPWIDLVKQILGNDVVLIHKGVFLSNPGAEAQVYHQDGPHLSTQYQRPCHAINVFIPLVDLDLRNGPTEFVVGSHILGYDLYDRDKLVTPEVPAGTPIIFDYRLGHRGLANTSNSCRPIVYCTYAAVANGKEFRDSVNFSRKRYHKLGEMVEKPMSRDERLKMRKIVKMEKANKDKEIEKLKTVVETDISEPDVGGTTSGNDTKLSSMGLAAKDCVSE